MRFIRQRFQADLQRDASEMNIQSSIFPHFNRLAQIGVVFILGSCAFAAQVTVAAIDEFGNPVESRIERVEGLSGACSKDANSTFHLTHKLNCAIGSQIEIWASLRNGGQLRLRKESSIWSDGQFIPIPVLSVVDSELPRGWSRQLNISKDLCGATTMRWLELRKVNEDRIFRFTVSDECRVHINFRLTGLFVATLFELGRPSAVGLYRESSLERFSSVRLSFVPLR